MRKYLQISKQISMWEAKCNDLFRFVAVFRFVHSWIETNGKIESDK